MIRIVQTTSRALRLLVLLFALAQGGLGSVLAVLDARLAAEAVGERAVAHVEAEGSGDCPRVHVDDCALCHLLSRPAGDVPRARATIVLATNATPPQRHDAAPTLSTGPPLPPSRAPPVA